MVIAMLLAHLIGDYVLQWDQLARWKARSIGGVLTHGAVVTSVTLLFSLPFDLLWWPWAVAIGIVHTAIDALQLSAGQLLQRWDSGIVTLGRFLADQFLHIVTILFALGVSGYLQLSSPGASLVNALESNRVLVYLLGYAFISMPTWILVEFFVYALINNSAPDFAAATNKYVGILERWIIATFVLLGYSLLIPLIALPRLVLDRRDAATRQGTTLYLAEFLASGAVAVLIGVWLRTV